MDADFAKPVCAEVQVRMRTPGFVGQALELRTGFAEGAGARAGAVVSEQVVAQWVHSGLPYPLLLPSASPFLTGLQNLPVAALAEGERISQMTPAATKTRTVHDFRREWLSRLIDEFGGNVERFAETTGRNAKHLIALRSGAKNMGPKVPREIERHLMMRRGSKVWPGMMDTDPDGASVTPLAVSERRGAYAAPAVALSQPGRHDDATMAQAVELLYLMADARPEDRRFARLTWQKIQIAAKAIHETEQAGGNQREIIASLLAELSKAE